MSETGKGALSTRELLYTMWQEKEGIVGDANNFFNGLGRAWLDHIASSPDLFNNHLQVIDGLPQGWYNDGKITEENFWLVREARRLYNEHFDVAYKRPICWPEIKDLKPELRWHFVHASVDDPTMVAFTPSHAYGVADRQVRTKVGKYLMTYYKDVLSEAEIKAIVAGNAVVDIQWGQTREEFASVYINGPDSCMAGEDDFETGGTHPTEAYASGDFRIAYVKRKDHTITARTVVHEATKTFVRLYGNDADRLEAALKKAGYTKESKYPEGAKLLKLPYRKGFILPFLDGNARYVKDKGKHFEISAINGVYYCDNTSGYFGDNSYRTCDHCGDDYDEDDTEFVETYNGSLICENCMEEYHVHAYYGTNHNRTGIFPTNDCVECMSDNDWYVDRPGVLSHHGIEHCAYSDQHWKAEDMVTLRDGDRCARDFAIEVGEDKNGSKMYDVPDNLKIDWFVRVEERTWHDWNTGEKTEVCIVQFLAPDLLDLNDKLPSNIMSVADAINLKVPVPPEWRHNWNIRQLMERMEHELATAMKAMQSNAA